MEVSVDRFGRILIPKAVRDRLGLRPASRLVLESDDHSITLEPSVLASQLERNSDGILVLCGDLETPMDDPVAWTRAARMRSLTDAE